ncbi:MAG: NUDIX domain-containing protein [Candidatus Saccharimonadales bacterium]
MTKRRMTVRGIVFKDGKLLAQQLTADHHGVQRDFWCTPGGGLDENEAILDGLKREMIEETGIAPKIGRLLFIQQFFDGEYEQVEFFFNIENTEDYENIDLSSTTHGIAEIKNVGFINLKESWILPKFLQDIDIQNYINENKDVLVVNNLK